MGVVGFIVGFLFGCFIPYANASSQFDRGSSLRSPGESPGCAVPIFMGLVLGSIGAWIGSNIQV